jgi:hypothetical protein
MGLNSGQKTESEIRQVTSESDMKKRFQESICDIMRCFDLMKFIVKYSDSQRCYTKIGIVDN